MRFYYHYTHEKLVDKIKQTGIYPNHPYFTPKEYFNAHEAGQALGVMPHNINCVLKFKDDGLFRKMEDVPSTNRFIGGGTQYLHPMRPRPIAMRKITHQSWQNI